jgi:hypothetical protein
MKFERVSKWINPDHELPQVGEIILVRVMWGDHWRRLQTKPARLVAPFDSPMWVLVETGQYVNFRQVKTWARTVKSNVMPSCWNLICSFVRMRRRESVMGLPYDQYEQRKTDAINRLR